MVKFNDYVKASDIWETAKDHEDLGWRAGLVRGYNLEIIKDGKRDWLSAEWIHGEPNEEFNDGYHTWRTTEHGFEYTGRICFRGYGYEEYDSEKRDFYIIDCDENGEITEV